MEAYGQVIDAREVFENMAGAARNRRQAAEEDAETGEILLAFADELESRARALVRVQGAAVGSRPPPLPRGIGGGASGRCRN